MAVDTGILIGDMMKLPHPLPQYLHPYPVVETQPPCDRHLQPSEVEFDRTSCVTDIMTMTAHLDNDTLAILQPLFYLVIRFNISSSF
jgi:hypothetical protein